MLSYEHLGGLRAVVSDADLDERCTGSATFDGTWFVAAGVPAECLGSPDSLRLLAALFYDTGHADPQAPVFTDLAPDDDLAVVDRAGSATPGGAADGALAGEDRYATSMAISRAQFPGPAAQVYLARADGFADASRTAPSCWCRPAVPCRRS